MSIITRRSLLTGLIAAPAVVAASSLMPVKAVEWMGGMQMPPDANYFLYRSHGITAAWTRPLTAEEIHRIYLQSRLRFEAIGYAAPPRDPAPEYFHFDDARSPT